LPNLTLATESLYSRLSNRRLRVYNAPDLRAHVLNAATVETSRGLRLSKEKQSLKIDGAVTLSFAIVAAEQAEVPATVDSEFRVDSLEVITTWNNDRGRPN
jgi:phage terminase large subunit-like protein